MTEQKKNHLWTYIVLSISISAVSWIVSLASLQDNGYLIPTAANFFTLLEGGFQNSEHALLALLFVAATFGPFLGAVVAIRLETGTVGLKNLFQSVRKWRVDRRWYGAILLVTVAITLIPTFFSQVVGLSSLADLVAVVPWHFYVLLFVFQMITSGLGEEVGWRGYLLPRLQERFQSEKALWVGGLIWAIWHYPFVIFLFSANMADLTMAMKILAILPSLAGFTMTIIGTGFIYAWLLKNTKSVFIAILFHALGNTLATIFGAEQLAAGPLALLTGFFPWVIVFILGKRYGKESFLP